MTIAFLLLLAAFVILYLVSRGKYADYTEPLDKKNYPLKDVLPAALFLLDKSGYKYSAEYDKRQLTKLAEISGHKYSMYYLRIFWAEKLTYLFMGLLAVLLIGMSQGASPGFLVFALVILSAAFFIPDSQLKDKLKKRHIRIQLDFPDFLNKLTLLINAGMTITKAWEKIVNDNTKKSPLYEELTLTLADIRGGKPEIQAYEDFAKRCRMSEISRFVSVIVQNLRKGSNEIVSILRLQANECWEMRKHAAKRLGEEASTKMLLPMMIMFIAVLIIVAVPAILSLQGL